MINGVLQIATVIVVFLSYGWSNVESISFRLDTTPPFVVLLSVTLAVQGMTKFLRSIGQTQCFLSTASLALAAQLAGWCILVSTYGISLHFIGTGMFVAGIALLELLFLIQIKNMTLNVLFFVDLVLIILFGIFYGQEMEHVAFPLEWSAIFLYSIGDITVFILYPASLCDGDIHATDSGASKRYYTRIDTTPQTRPH